MTPADAAQANEAAEKPTDNASQGNTVSDSDRLKHVDCQEIRYEPDVEESARLPSNPVGVAESANPIGEHEINHCWMPVMQQLRTLPSVQPANNLQWPDSYVQPRSAADMPGSDGTVIHNPPTMSEGSTLAWDSNTIDVGISYRYPDREVLEQPPEHPMLADLDASLNIPRAAPSPCQRADKEQCFSDLLIQLGVSEEQEIQLLQYYRYHVAPWVGTLCILADHCTKRV